MSDNKMKGYNPNKMYQGNAELDDEKKITLKERLLIFGLTASVLPLMYVALSQNLFSRLNNAIFGSGNCYVEEKIKTKKGDNYWSLTKGVDSRDRDLVIQLICAKNRFEYGIFECNKIPTDKEIYVIKNSDCSEKGAKKLDDIIKEAGPFF